MRGRRTTLAGVVAAVLTAALTGACDDDAHPGGSEASADATLVAVDAGGGAPPELTTRLEVEVGTAVAVYSRGCRPSNARQRCSPDGTQTYTLAGRLHEATVVGAWVQLGTGGHSDVHVRFADKYAATVTAVRKQADEVGGLLVVLDAHSGDVLEAIPAPAVRGLMITRHDLQKSAAVTAVERFVTAATGR